MRHPDASLAAYVEGSATPRERATVEAHLASCPTCRREVKRARAAQEALARLPEVKAPGLDAAAIIQSAAAARATRRKATPASTAPTLVVVPTPTEAWAPAAPTAIEEGAESVEAAPDGEVGAEEEPAPVEDDLARRRRERDRSRAIRVVETALGAAAVLVAIVLFVGLRNPASNQPARAPAAPTTGPSAEGAGSNLVGGAVNYDTLTLSAHAKELVSVINSSNQLLDAQAMPAYAPARTTGTKSETEKGLACIQRGTNLLKGTRIYELELAGYQGRPAWIGAFLVDYETEHPLLLVLAVSEDGCIPQQVIREPLKSPASSSPSSS